MTDSGRQPKPAAKPKRPTTVGAVSHHSQLPIVRITIDDAVLVLGVLELVSADLEPDTDLALLVERSAARIAARLSGLAEALSPVVPPTADGPLARGADNGPRKAVLGPPPGERRTPA